jgi:hypothetical protein
VDENVEGIEIRFDVAYGLFEVVVVDVTLAIKQALDDGGVAYDRLEPVSLEPQHPLIGLPNHENLVVL